MLAPSTFSNSSALPPRLAAGERSRSWCACGAGVLQTRSQISEISSLADTFVLMRANSPFFSKNEMNSPNVALGMAQNVKRHAPAEQTARSFHDFCSRADQSPLLLVDSSH